MTDVVLGFDKTTKERLKRQLLFTELKLLCCSACVS